MAKGPKRQVGRARTKTGRLSRSKKAVEAHEGDVMSVVLNQPHRRWLGASRRIDQNAESALGRLYLAGRITEPELWAGQRWARIVHEFHHVLASPSTTLSSALGRMVGDAVDNPADADHLSRAGTASTDETLLAERQESEQEKRDRVLSQHGAAMRAIRAMAESRAIFLALELSVLDDVDVADEADVQALRRGLTALARLWKMAPPPDPLAKAHGPRVRVEAWKKTVAGRSVGVDP